MQKNPELFRIQFKQSTSDCSNIISNDEKLVVSKWFFIISMKLEPIIILRLSS